MLPVIVKFTKLHPDAKPFAYTRTGDACMDMYALQDIVIPVGYTKIVPTGIAIELPQGYEGIVRGRSGLASKGIIVHVGTVDDTYRGDVGVIIHNFSFNEFKVEKHNRIAQFTIKSITLIQLEEAIQLSSTERGQNGYGSSGL